MGWEKVAWVRVVWEDMVLVALRVEWEVVTWEKGVALVAQSLELVEVTWEKVVLEVMVLGSQREEWEEVTWEREVWEDMGLKAQIVE